MGSRRLQADVESSECNHASSEVSVVQQLAGFVRGHGLICNGVDDHRHLYIIWNSKYSSALCEAHLYFYMRYEHDRRPSGKRHFVTYEATFDAALGIISITRCSQGQEPGTVSWYKYKRRAGLTYDGGSCWNVDLHKILAVVPWHISREESGILRDAVQTTKGWAISVDDNAVSTSLLNTNPVVGKAVARVEVKDPEQPGALKDDDLVLLVLEGDVGLWAVEPAIFLFCPLHLAVKLVQEAVSQQLVVWQIELTAGIVEAVAVALAWKIEPLWMAKFVALEVEVTFTTESVGDQANHLVQSHTTLNHRRKFAES